MTISLKSDASGNSGAIQVAGVDRLTLNLDGSLLAGANPATGNRSMAIATMQKFADEFGASLTGNGYQKLPSGLIIQWGYVLVPASAVATVTFPIAFPNAGLVGFASKYDSVINGSTYRWDCSAPSKTQMAIGNNFSGAAIGGAWLVIGN